MRKAECSSADPVAQGTGTAYITWHAEAQVYSGYWDQWPDGPPAVLEQIPDTAVLLDAIAWARSRTPVVMVRPAFAPDTTFWGGTEPKPAEFGDLPSLP